MGAHPVGPPSAVRRWLPTSCGRQDGQSWRFAGFTRADMRCASGGCRAPSKAPIERPRAFFHGGPRSRAAASPSSRFELCGSKHPERGTMFPDGSGVPLRFTKENCHVCNPSNESVATGRRAAGRFRAPLRSDPAGAATGCAFAPDRIRGRSVREHSSTSRLVHRPGARSTVPAMRRPAAVDADSSANRQSRGVHRLP